MVPAYDRNAGYTRDSQRLPAFTHGGRIHTDNWIGADIDASSHAEA
jgi:hypothetical protein